MNPYKKLLGNSALFAIGNLGSRLISIILVPLYTYYLTTSEYGTVDLVTTTSTMLLPIISLSIYDAVLRFVMDKNDSAKQILTNSLLVTIFGSGVLLLISPVLFYLNVLGDHLPFMLIILILQSFQMLLSQFTRATGYIKEYALNGIIMTLVTGLMNILLLMSLNKGIEGYLISIVFSNIVSIIYLCYSTKAYKYISVNDISMIKTKNMLIYSIPLIPNAFMWWLINASNRYFIFLFVGASANGLFAVANKIPNLLSVLSSIFFQAWQLSAIEEFDSGSNSNLQKSVFKYFYTIMFLGSSAILIILKPLINFSVENSYYESWKIVPFLLLGIVFSSFSSFLGTNYIVAKQTKGVFQTSLIGGILSILLNLALVPIFGAVGASISTMLSFFVVWILRIKDTKRFVEIKYDKLAITLNILVLFIQTIILYLDFNNMLEILIQSILFSALLIINRHLFILIKQLFLKRRR